MSIVTQRELKRLCLEHLPQLEATVWRNVFHSSCDDWHCDSCDFDHAHHLDVSQDEPSKVAYSPDGVGPDDHARRRKIALGRYLARQWKVNIDRDIERGINAIVGALAPASLEDEFQLLRGNDVTEAYVNGVGCRSCMVGEEQRHITEWFAAFPDKIGLLVWGGNRGRALLWTDDNGHLILDRIYSGNRDLAKERYAMWCAANGAFSSREELNGIPCSDHACVTLGDIACDGRPVPYLDTFCYCDADGGHFYSYPGSHTNVCQSTEGGPFYGGVCCDHCETVRGGDTYEVDGETWCSECREDAAMWCERCEQYSHEDNATDVDGSTWCARCAREHAEQCSCCDEYSASTVEVEDSTFCDNCAVENTMYCDQCRDDRLSAGAACVGNDTWCSDCVSLYAAECTECCEQFPVANMVSVSGGHCCSDCHEVESEVAA